MWHRYENQQLCLTQEAIAAYCPNFGAYAERAAAHQAEIRSILHGVSPKLLLIVGPCSAWPVEATLAYAKRLSVLHQTVNSQVCCVMRVYTQKPRTRLGWRGIGAQPDLNEPPDINAGILASLDLFTQILDLGLPVADEILSAHQIPLLSPLLSWAAIGARSSLDQEHCAFASALGCPVGMKNPIYGPIEAVVDAVLAARAPHVTVFEGRQVRTLGNPDAHIVLRGADALPNYSPLHLNTLMAAMPSGVSMPVLVDASHDNARIAGLKDVTRQSGVIAEILAMRTDPSIARLIKGFMVESFIKPGHQSPEGVDISALDQGGLSITDPCLGWEETESLILAIAEHVAEHRPVPQVFIPA